MINQSIIAILVVILSVTVCYEIPEVTVERLTPKGIRVSIPDESGVHFFAFHSNVNKPININNNGDIAGEVSRARDTRWTYKNKNIVLKPDDVLHFWIYVQVNGQAYTFLGSSDQNRETRQKNSSSSEINSVCETSVTTVRGKPAACKNRLVFEEQFNTDLDSLERIVANLSWWDREIYVPLDPDYEFTSYRELRKNLEVENGTLKIIPLISDEEYGQDSTMFGRLNLGELCTASLPAECNRHAVGYNILPPVISARLTTKQTFHFRYGRIEIRAKFPKGDWLYPELWLQPKAKTYGVNYSSGRVILGMARGNKNLIKVADVRSILGSSIIEFGLRIGPNDDISDAKIIREKDFGTWTDDFHVYTTIWDENGFKFQVDGEEVGQINPPSGGWLNSNRTSGKARSEKQNQMIPYNDEFYITVGLGVGGIRVFPDSTMNGKYAKPWRNVEPKGMLNFWRARDRWLPTWKDKNGAIDTNFQVDYIRVWTV